MVPIAPTAPMINPITPIRAGAANAAIPPAPSITAAAICVGATARSTSVVTSIPRLRASVHMPEPPMRTAMHRLTTAPTTMVARIRAG